MIHQRRRTAAALASAALAVVLLGLSACAADETKKKTGDDLVIGASLELSGPTASIGTTYKKALELEVADLNKKGLPDGGKIKLVVKDNETKPEQNIANVNALIKNDKADALVTGGCSACTVPVTGIVDRAKVPLISLASASAITEPVDRRHYTFKISPDPAQDASVLVHALKEKGIKKIGLLGVNNVYGQDGRKSVTARAKAQGIKVVSSEQFGQDDKDMTVQVQKIMQKKPDAFVVWSVMPAAGIIAKNIKDAGYPGGVYLDAGAGAELFVKGAGSAAEGTHMVFPRVLAINDVDSGSDQVAAQKRWYKQYTEKYGAYSGFASFAADAVQMLVDASGHAAGEGDDATALRDALEKEGVDGLSGRIQNSAEEHSGLQPESLALLQVEDGQWHLAK